MSPTERALWDTAPTIWKSPRYLESVGDYVRCRFCDGLVVWMDGGDDAG